MKQALRMSSAAVALAVFLAVPAHAQDETVDAASEPTPILAAPASEDAVGPAQLRDFSINGTVTRRADTPATAPAQPAPAPASTQAARTPTAPAQTAGTNPAPAASDSRQAGTQQPRSGEASTVSRGLALPPPTAPSGQPASFAPAIFPQSTPASVASPVADTGSSSFPLWPWIVALLAAIGAGAWYFRRQKSGYAFVGAGGDASAFDLSPAPAPPRAAPMPKPQSAPRAPVPDFAPAPKSATAPVGIVSTRLRPWLEIEFSPEAAIVDEGKGAIQFEVTIFNSGSAPARDVHVEGALFNASPDQDQVLGQFFAQPNGQAGDRISIPPLQRMSFRSLVSLPREQLHLFQVEGRTLFVPLVGFNVVYAWSSGQGQTSTSFIVGRNFNGEKMAPFRIDQGAKTFRGLGAREHTLRVRK
jgi:hypothetical protein